jgi:hypothetical protein
MDKVNGTNHIDEVADPFAGDAISDETINFIWETLANLREPQESSGSGWSKSCLVSKTLGDQPNTILFEAIRDVFEDVLEVLEASRPDYVHLLLDRFWDGQKVDNMLSPERPWGEGRSTFHEYQRRAIRAFANIFWGKEKACRRQAEGASRTGTR